MLRWILALFLLVPAAVNAKVEYIPETKIVEISNVTTTYSALQFFNILQENEVSAVLLSGPGGNAVAGLEIGKLLRKHDLTVVIPDGKVCVSACAFAALGGTRIIVGGELWFHGPFLPSIPTTESAHGYGNRLSAFNIKVSRYLLDMGINLEFYEKVLENTSQCKLLVLDESSLIDKIKIGTSLDIPILVDSSYCKSGSTEDLSP